MNLKTRVPGLVARIRAFVRRLTGLGRREEDDERMDEEMRFHLDQLVDHFRMMGASAEESRRRAALEFGGLVGHQEAARDQLRNRWIEDGLRDLRHGARGLLRHPGFAITTVVTIGLGVAAAVTVFSIVDSIFLRPLPVATGDRLVSITFLRPSGRADWLGTAGAGVLEAKVPAFDAVAAHDSRVVLYLSGRGFASQRFGAYVSPSYFTLLGVHPVLGRFFLPKEDSVPDRDAVAVIGNDLWRTQFRGDSGVLGEHMQVRGRDVTIVGVAPAGFSGISVGGAPNELWLPTRMLGISGETCVGRPGCREADVMARLAPGATLSMARAQVEALVRELGQAAYTRDTVPTVRVALLRGMAASQRSDYVSLAKLLAAIALLIVVIACANVGGLLVTRGLTRAPEVALRYSLGAGSGRVIRQLLAENLLIGLAGGVLGVLLSLGAVRTLMAFFATDSEGFQHFYYLGLDVRVLVFALGAALGSVLLFGVLPAISTSRVALSQYAGGARVVGRGKARGRLLLMGAQVAVSLTLLVGAVLMARSFRGLMHRQRFDPANVALIRLRPEMIHYDSARAKAFLRNVVGALDGLPDVTAVAYGRGIGFLWDEGPSTWPLGRTRTDTVAAAYTRFVSPGFLSALKIPLLAGREFTPRDDAGAPLVAIVTEAVARKLWPGGGAVDRTVVLGGKEFRVVGVAADFVVHTDASASLPVVLVPFWQDPFQPEVDARLAVRVRGDPEAALPELRRVVNAVDPAVPVTELMPFATQVDTTYITVHLGAVVLIVAAGIGLFLTGLGLFGVIGFVVERRTREIGVRVALGARPSQILGLMLRQGIAVTAVGGLAGLVLAAFGARFLAAYLVGVDPGDQGAFATAFLAVAAVSLLASCVPAVRAVRVDPMTALRVD